MACPFFKATYIGYCSACDFPYTPSIIEMEQHCFKNGFECCAHFNNNLNATEQVAKELLDQGFEYFETLH